MKKEQFKQAQKINNKIERLEELKVKINISNFGLIKEIGPIEDVLELNKFVDESFEEMQDEYALINALHNAINSTIKESLNGWIDGRIKALEVEFENI